VRIPPEKAEACADHRAAEHGQFTGGLDMQQVEVVREDGMARDVRKRGVRRRRNRERADRQAVEPVRQVHRVRRRHKDKRRKRHVPPPDVRHPVLAEREQQSRVVQRRILVGQPDERQADRIATIVCDANL
jgi:hypothetical protein